MFLNRILLTTLHYLFFLASGTFFLFSCVSHKDLLNVQSKTAEQKRISHTQSEYLLQEGDILSIKVASLDPQSVAIFNKSIGGNVTTQANEASIYLNSYIVNEEGEIVLPIIGAISIAGLSLDDSQKMISEKMDTYYKYASVDVKLMSFRVTVLGEVVRQGTFIIYNSNANILQAIGEAGGLTDLADRTKIRILRKDKAQTNLTYINLHSDQLISSESYYLQPNDIIYIEPLKAKASRLNMPALQIGISALTLIVVMLNFFRK